MMKSLITFLRQNVCKLSEMILLRYLYYEYQSLFALLSSSMDIFFRPIYHVRRSTDRELPSCKPRIGRASINT